MNKHIYIGLAAGVLMAASAHAQVPGTGIAPSPNGVVPGGVVPVPSPGSPGTLNNPAGTYTAPDVSPGALTTAVPNLTPPGSGIGVAPVPGIPGQSPVGTPTINTFNEQQIRSNLLAQGYSSVAGLTVDGSGTWHGTAVRNGSNVAITIDSNGIVTPH